MFEIILNASLSAVITTLSLVIGYYVLSKKADKVIEIQKISIKNDLEAWLNSEKGQKALYSIGALIGNGARTGIGIQSKSGKFKWQDLLGQVVGSYVQTKVLPSMGNSNVVKTIKSTSESLKIE